MYTQQCSIPSNYHFHNFLPPFNPQLAIHPYSYPIFPPNPNQAKNKLCSGKNKNQEIGKKQKSDRPSKVWTAQDQKKLQEMHNLMGNKWVEISQALLRTQNQVKNHYHSKLRKTLRKVNHFIYVNLKKDYKPFKMSIISKVIQISQEKFTQGMRENEYKFNTAFQLKNKIIEVDSLLDSTQLTPEQQLNVTNLVKNLAKFNKNKKKPIRFMRNNYSNLRKHKNTIRQEPQQPQVPNQCSIQHSNSQNEPQQHSASQNNNNILQKLAPHPNPQPQLNHTNFNPYVSYYQPPMMVTYYLPSPPLPPMQVCSCCQKNSCKPSIQGIQEVKKEQQNEVKFNYIGQR